MLLIKVKKIVNSGAGEVGITCYKCHKNKASFYLVREVDSRVVHVPMCGVCLSAYLNYLDDRIILWHYNHNHPNDKEQ